MQTHFAQYILNHPGRMPMPIGVYAGLEMTGATVRQAVTDASIQAEAVMAMHEWFKTPALLTAMDLSAEAETYGCVIRMEDHEIPTVIGRRATSLGEIKALPDPKPGEGRTRVHLDAARKLAANREGTPVLGGMIGPFSLAGRIFGVSEALEATVIDPGLVLALLEKVTNSQIQYALAFRDAGAQGLIVAEPAAGLLSPRGLAAFSAPFVKRIVEATQRPDFAILYHNCGAKLAHLARILEMGPEIFHFGQPMDLPAALEQAQGGFILGGNLDPSAVFHGGSPDSVRQRTLDLLDATQKYPAYFISSGCDLPPGVPVANMEAFYSAVRNG